LKDKSEYKDFISFLDENGKREDVWVIIISTENNLVTFEAQSSNIISIPTFRVLKIKRKGDSDG